VINTKRISIHYNQFSFAECLTHSYADSAVRHTNTGEICTRMKRYMNDHLTQVNNYEKYLLRDGLLILGGSMFFVGKKILFAYSRNQAI
jgi:hypothetical protein